MSLGSILPSLVGGPWIGSTTTLPNCDSSKPLALYDEVSPSTFDMGTLFGMKPVRATVSAPQAVSRLEAASATTQAVRFSIARC